MDFFEEMRRMQKEIERMMQAAYSGFDFRQPVIEIIDKGKNLVVIAELPGVDKKDISLSCDGFVLDIEARTSKKEEKKRKGFYYSERKASVFKRSISLPEEVDFSKAKASFKNGVLEIVLPKKTAKARKKQKIKIQ